VGPYGSGLIGRRTPVDLFSQAYEGDPQRLRYRARAAAETRMRCQKSSETRRTAGAAEACDFGTAVDLRTIPEAQELTGNRGISAPRVGVKKSVGEAYFPLRAGV
jgi:hypothetical protein